MPAALLAIGLMRSKWPGVEKVALWCAFGLSLLAACLLVKGHQQAVFYLLPFRAWELLAGSLIGVGAVPPVRSKLLAEMCSLAGIGLIVASIVLLSSSSMFPGFWAVPPVLGAALVIHAGALHQTTLAARILGLAPIRFVGLISYSLYLWHWPLIVFYPFLFGQATSAAKGALLLASLAAATLSWAFVEKPFRQGEALRRRKSAFIAAGVTIAGVVAVAAAMPRLSQVIAPTSPVVMSILDQKSPPDNAWRQGSCFLTSAAKDTSTFDAAKCLARDASKANVLLVGDSHGAMYYPALSSLPGINVMQATSSGCVPVAHPEGEARCVRLMNTTFRRVALNELRVRTVILAARWKAADAAGLADRIRLLQSQGLKVIVLGPVNEYSQPLPRIAALAAERNNIKPSDFLKRDTAVNDEAIGRAVGATGASYISVRHAICRPQCRVWADNSHLMQFDYGHLTPAGARWVIQHVPGGLRL